MRLWRISPVSDWREAAKRPATARWHTRGPDVLYTSSNDALAVLEALAHLAEQLKPHRASMLELPGTTEMRRIEPESLPHDWPSRQSVTRAIGNAWLRDGATPLLWVPSVHAPACGNVLINTRHPRLPRIDATDCGVFRFNPRLRRNLRDQ